MYIHVHVCECCRNDLVLVFVQAQLQSVLDKISQRIEDVRKLVVTSPDKLRAVSGDHVSVVQ